MPTPVAFGTGETRRRGGRNRRRIVRSLADTPMNTDRLADEHDLDSKTTQHHLELFTENNGRTTMGADYGKMYFLTDQLEHRLDVLDELAAMAGLEDHAD